MNHDRAEESADAPPRSHHAVWRLTVCWLLFFAICGGLGYPVLNRYDPRTVPALSDVRDYARIVVEGPGKSGRRSYRILQPLAGKLVFKLARGRVGSWDPVLLSLLVTGSALVAATAVILMLLGGDLASGPAGAGLIASLLYVCNFWVPNGALAGLIDGSEACLMLLTVWVMRRGGWRWLPLLGVLGALAKETFVPLMGVFAIVWIAAESGCWRVKLRRSASAVLMVATGLASVMAVRYALDGQAPWPWELASEERSSASLTAGAARIFGDAGLYYGFVWLGPLAVWGLPKMPRAWVAGAAAACLATLLLGAWRDAGGANVGRELFNVAGPLLCLAAARTLMRLFSADVDAQISRVTR